MQIIFREISKNNFKYLIMSVKKRLKDFIKSQKMTISGFEKDINVSNGYVNSISKGIGGEVLLFILEKSPNLNINWLLTGEGSMLKESISPAVSSSQSQENDKYTSLLEKQVAILERENTYQAKEIQRLEKEIQRLGGKKIYSLEDKIEYQRQELIAKDNEILALKSPGAETYNAPVSPKRV